MPYILKKVGGNPNIPYKEFVCDEVIDITLIDTKTVQWGSTCYVINTGETYILNSQKQWKKYQGTTSGGDTSGGTGGGTSDTIIYDGGSANG